MYETKLSVVIVNYNVKYLLEQCLRSVQAATNGFDAEIWVVDNASTDGSVEYLRPRFPDVRFIENTDNPGFARANNQALRACRGEYVLLLNPDTIVGDSLRTLCYFMDGCSDAGAIGVKMIDGRGAFLPESKRSFPSPWVAFCKLFGLSKLFPRSRRYAAYSLPYLNPDKQHEVEVLSGAFMLLRHEALDRVGLFDESFFMYGEDIDLSYRIVLGGYKNYYIPERILHYKGESTAYADKKYLNAFYDAMLIFYRKHYPRSGRWMSGLIRASVGLRKGVARLFGWKKPKTPKPKRRSVLIFCRAEALKTARDRVAERLPEAVVFRQWDLDERRAMDALSRRVRMNEYTDMVFGYPDMTFDQMLLFMDRNTDKSCVYHIYYPDSGLLISPGR
ncbi:glycosyltransferase family 2 protein [Tannerella sp.]|uniref:glycosyltransferase family 2 protein n=1 Tax=Tannerella sp. TaxID=2382127 RepID=UPI0026DC5CF6|nr:glycosyltransferase family 2 protein [Tannerella sp.]MDO4703437.1 glycosyltransferase family 2 protein [Tannerella sp.]